jgi:hypothetical protein
MQKQVETQEELFTERYFVFTETREIKLKTIGAKIVHETVYAIQFSVRGETYLPTAMYKNGVRADVHDFPDIWNEVIDAAKQCPEVLQKAYKRYFLEIVYQNQL